MSVAAIVLTLNEERNIEECLASLAWAGHSVVVDCFSTDATVSLARRAGAEVIQHPFEDYAQQRNAALDQLDTTRGAISSWLNPPFALDDIARGARQYRAARSRRSSDLRPGGDL